MINSQTNNRKKQQVQLDYLSQPIPDIVLSSQFSLEPYDQAQKFTRATTTKHPYLQKNIDLDSDVIREEYSLEDLSESDSIKQSEVIDKSFDRKYQVSPIQDLKTNKLENDNLENYLSKNKLETEKEEIPKIISFSNSYKNLNTLCTTTPIKKNVDESKSIYENFNFLQRLFLMHIFSFMRRLRTLLLTSITKITLSQLPSQISSDTIEYNLDKIHQIKTNKWNTWILFKLFFYQQSKYTTFSIVMMAMFETYSRFIMAILTETLISAVQDQDMQSAYLQALALAILSIIALISKHYQQYIINNFGTKMRMILINLIYERVMEMNQHQVNIGQLMNLVSSDLNIIEYQLSYVYIIAIIPGSLLFSSIILWLRFDGPLGLIAIFICAILYPFQILIQKINKKQWTTTRNLQDKRISLTNLLIEGIKYLKMYTWENVFIKKIFYIRNKEFFLYFKIHFLNLLDRSFNYSIHIWGSFIFIIILYYSNVDLTISKIVGTIQLMSMIKYYCIFQVSYAFQAIMNFSVIFNRIAQIMNQKNDESLKTQTTMNDLTTNKTETSQILLDRGIQQNSSTLNRALKRQSSFSLKNSTIASFSQFSCKWNQNLSYSLENISLDIKSGEILVILGKVGSGKSTLLQSILQEVPFFEGNLSFQKKLKIAYVEQDPFIYTGTIRENILFGKEYDQILYLKVLEVSCLDQDILTLVYGDKTEIGEKGTNLSGGQRARLSLARALYSLADLYLFDDPLSAVDSKVADNIFNNAIKEFIFQYQPNHRPSLKKLHQTFLQQVPTVILATHQISYALLCDYAVILEKGQIKNQGSVKKLRKNLLEFSFGTKDSENHLIDQKSRNSRRHSKIISKVAKLINETDKENITQNLYVSEDLQHQDADLDTYKRYFSYWKPSLLILFILLQNIGTEIINNYYYNYMSNFDGTDSVFFTAGLLVLIAYINNVLKYLFNIFGVLYSNNLIHSKMLKRLIQAPISYFDTNPSGRLINRFSTDLSLADTQIQSIITDIFEQGAQFCVSLVTIAIIQPYFTFALLLTIGSTIIIFRLTRIVVSQLKVCDLIARSPLFDQFKVSIFGMTQIKIHDNYKWINDKFLKLSNQSMHSNMMFLYSQRCFGFYIDLFGQFTNIIGIFLCIGMIKNTSLFSQALLLLSTFNTQAGTLRQIMQFDSIMNSINRMFEICDINIENYENYKQEFNPKIWPRFGTIIFQNVYMQYRPETPFVLKGMSFRIKNQEKIGIVGRTGAGKSSLIQALFRLSEISDQSCILIDNTDIKQVSLMKLREEISIIPQVPFLFQGTLRENIDPLQQFDDMIIKAALSEVGLKGLSLDQNMQSELFSIGQKQLICLCRVLLNKKKILILDEATANIDMATDTFIQDIIQKKFKDCTIITIAHRLNTIANYDRIFVLNDGQVQEQGHPYELLVQNPKQSSYINNDSLFAKMVLQTGTKNSSQIYGIARKAYLKNHEITRPSNRNSKVFDVSPSSINEFQF